jgi:hypothetical protein
LKMKINELSTRYLIPGYDLEPTAVAEPEEAGEEYGDAPYGQMPPADLPSPGGWKELLGLNQVSPGPSQIDPPTRPASFKGVMRAKAQDASLPFPRSALLGGMGGAPSSPKVGRMLGLLAEYRRAAIRIRARTLDGRR